MTLVSHHPHSRFFLREKPDVYPGLDLINNTPDGPVIDLGVDLDSKLGVAYLRVTDVEEMARVLGYITREDAEALRNRIVELEAQVNRAPDLVEGFMHELRDTVDRFSGRLSADSGAVGDYPETYTKQIGSREISPGELSGDSEASESGSPSDSRDSSEGAYQSDLFSFLNDGEDGGEPFGEPRQDGDAISDEGPAELSGDSGDEFNLFGFSSDD